MKTIVSNQSLDVPEGVDVSIKSRKVVVKGPRGTLTRDFKHATCDLHVTNNGRKVNVEMWFVSNKKKAAIRSICSHITNMINGVTKGYRYKMKFVYAHFPVNANIPDGGKSIEIRNFLGEKVVRRVNMLDGCSIKRSTDARDQIEIEGNDVELVSQSAANIHQSCLVRNKDIRKFLDGIYVSDKGFVVEEEE